ncbi:hypothetical protein C8Q77DRAFT_1092327 [Trametes polyzona]|nr:hypothetical protein C8Q77DRAFT_1092327 [Trametes polyzona]
MAAQYGYPQFYYPTPYLYPYYHQPHVSPFIPPVTLPGSPQLYPRDERRVHWEDDPYPPRRQRRPSWHGGLMPPPNPQPFPSPPMLFTPLPQMVPLAPAAAPAPYYTHQRRSSDSCLPQPAWVTFPTMVQPVAFQPPTPPAPAIHPLLNGENAAGPMLLFDLSLNTFNPQRVTKLSQTAGTPLSLEELREPATFPAVRRMTIVCERLPEWPIVLEPHTVERERSRERSPFLGVPRTGQGHGGAEDAPVTVYDVLMAIHRTVQRQISHVDWARLTRAQTHAISAAYTRRCRTFPSAAAFEEAQGVRRVDYLLDSYMFRGLVRDNVQDGFSKMKLIVGPAHDAR